jgi:hypothetical protein
VRLSSSPEVDDAEEEELLETVTRTAYRKGLPDTGAWVTLGADKAVSAPICGDTVKGYATRNVADLVGAQGTEGASGRGLLDLKGPVCGERSSGPPIEGEDMTIAAHATLLKTGGG